MPTGPKGERRPRDVNSARLRLRASQWAMNPRIMARAEKTAAAVALGRKGGLKGGKARAAKMSKSSAQPLPKKAAKARWDRT